MHNVHVGVQVRHDPNELVRGDATDAAWDVDIDVVDRDGELDFRGTAVHGKRGDRFVYLTWGDVGADGGFEVFRRAKPMLDRVDPSVLERARRTGELVGRVDLTDGLGGPRCARVDPPAIEWSVGRR